MVLIIPTNSAVGVFISQIELNIASLLINLTNQMRLRHVNHLSDYDSKCRTTFTSKVCSFIYDGKDVIAETLLGELLHKIQIVTRK